MSAIAREHKVGGSRSSAGSFLQEGDSQIEQVSLASMKSKNIEIKLKGDIMQNWRIVGYFN